MERNGGANHLCIYPIYETNQHESLSSNMNLFRQIEHTILRPNECVELKKKKLSDRWYDDVNDAWCKMNSIFCQRKYFVLKHTFHLPIYWIGIIGVQFFLYQIHLTKNKYPFTEFSLSLRSSSHFLRDLKLMRKMRWGYRIAKIQWPAGPHWLGPSSHMATANENISGIQFFFLLSFKLLLPSSKHTERCVHVQLAFPLAFYLIISFKQHIVSTLFSHSRFS